MCEELLPAAARCQGPTRAHTAAELSQEGERVVAHAESSPTAAYVGADQGDSKMACTVSGGEDVPNRRAVVNHASATQGLTPIYAKLQLPGRLRVMNPVSHQPT